MLAPCLMKSNTPNYCVANFSWIHKKQCNVQILKFHKCYVNNESRCLATRNLSDIYAEHVYTWEGYGNRHVWFVRVCELLGLNSQSTNPELWTVVQSRGCHKCSNRTDQFKWSYVTPQIFFHCVNRGLICETLIRDNICRAGWLLSGTCIFENM